MRAKEFIIEMAALAPGLFKYKGTSKDRVPIFLDKIKNSSPFKVKTKSGIEDITIDKAELPRVQQWINNPVGNLSLKSDTGQKIPLGSIVKTKEFGGEDAGKRESLEQGQIQEIQNQLEKLKDGQPSIKLKIGNRIVNAASVGKTKETVGGKQPKSDMTVYDEAGNSVAWVSLKGIYFRWGGWLHLISLPDIAKWLKKISQEINGTILQPGMAFGHQVPDEIKNLIVFGKDFGRGNPGISNVDMVIIGNPVIKKVKDHYEIFADKVYNNGETPTGNHEPYLVLRYMQGRPDAGFSNARAETNTRSEGRKVKWLD